jgi:potassium efflux system protein
MSVGLGFGLQDIFANFISGIILLFERPIRVGDIVTLGDKSGVVNRIRMRSTTIVDWDRKEYIVPNKDLVTERLLNWTLSDQINRIEMRVPVAQGTDTDLACGLLMEAALEQPEVMADPAPQAVFDGFGDGTLNLVLRCYLPTLERRTQTMHAMYTAIDHKFRAAGIPLPNKDLWVRGIAEGTPLQVVGKPDAGRALRSA